MNLPLAYHLIDQVSDMNKGNKNIVIHQLTHPLPITGRRHEDICSALWFRYCPFDREEDVILHPPSRGAWMNFTTFQKALWLVDETEARWHRLVAENPFMNYTEVDITILPCSRNKTSI